MVELFFFVCFSWCVFDKQKVKVLQKHTCALLTVPSLFWNVFLQNLQYIQGQSDPTNLCSPCLSGVGGETTQLLSLLTEGLIWRLDNAYTHTQKQPTFSRLQLHDVIQVHLIDMDTLPPTCHHWKCGCIYSLQPPGDATDALFRLYTHSGGLFCSAQSADKIKKKLP